MPTWRKEDVCDVVHVPPCPDTHQEEDVCDVVHMPLCPVTHQEEDVCDVVHDERERADAGEVARPREGKEADGHQVVQQHLPKVLHAHGRRDGGIQSSDYRMSCS